MKIIPHNQEIHIDPKKLACPICGAALTVEIDAWEQCDDGTWCASESGVHCSCSTEPDLDSDELEDWFNGHFSMPYVDWLPVNDRVYRSLFAHVRFDMEKTTA